MGTSNNSNICITQPTQNAHLPRAVGDAVHSVPSNSTSGLATLLLIDSQAITLESLEVPQ